MPLDGALRGDDRRGRAVGDARRVAGRDRAHRRAAAVLAVGQVEDRLEPAPAPRAIVSRRGPSSTLTTVSPPFASRIGDRRDLGVEPAGVDGRDRLLVARERERVLVLAADALVDRHALGVGAHVAVLDRAPQPVGDGRVDELAVAEPVAEARLRQQVRRLVHRLHAARDDDLGVARADLGGGEHDRLQARAADAVDRRRAGRVGQSGARAPPGAPAPGRRPPGAPGPSGPRRSGVARAVPDRSTAAADRDATELDCRARRPAPRRTCRSASGRR